MGTYGETPETDIAIDAVCITTCKGENPVAVTLGLKHVDQ